MPLNPQEAGMMFTRIVDRECERTDALRLGVQLLQNQSQAIQQQGEYIQVLTKALQDAKIPVPQPANAPGRPNLSVLPKE